MLNLTPHPIVLMAADGESVTIAPSGKVARVATEETQVGTRAGVPVVRRTWTAVEGLPPEGEPCLVSALVLERVPGRHETYAPDTGPSSAVRDEAGRIVAVRRLIAA